MEEQQLCDDVKKVTVLKKRKSVPCEPEVEIGNSWKKMLIRKNY